MPSILTVPGNPASFPQTQFYVDVKQNWSSSWVFIPFLQPLRCSEVSAPQIGQAELVYRFGSIKWENSVSFATFTQPNYIDYFVRIRCATVGRQPEVIFTGIITDSETVHHSGTSNIGDTTFHARELGYILDSIVINDAITEPIDYLDNKEMVLDWTPTFNRSGKKTGEIIGNRTRSTTLETSPNIVPRFELRSKLLANSTQVWSNYDIVRYLLDRYSPSGITFRLEDIKVDGSPYLDQIKQIHDLGGLTVWQALQRLIDRRRGVSFRTQIIGGDIVIKVFSTVDFAINIAGKTLPANTNFSSLILPSTLPYTHLVGDIPFNVTSSNLYDQITVRGDLIRVAGTFGYMDETLVEGWDDSAASDYNTAGADASSGDLERQASKYDDVYTTLIVPDDWTGKTGNGTGDVVNNEENYQYLFPSASNDGQVYFFSSVVPDFWRDGKIFDRMTFFQRGVDYSTSGAPSINSSSNNINDFVPFSVMIKDTVGTDHDPDSKWHFVEKLSVNPDLSDAHVLTMDNNLGFRLKKTPNHYFGKNHFNPNTHESNFAPELNYQELICTGCVRSDDRQQFSAKRIRNPVKKLTIDVPAAQYWHAAPGTAYDVDATGGLKYVHTNNRVVRNDVDLLKSIMAAALGWYGVYRQAVSIPIRQAGRYIEIGTFLRSITGVSGSAIVRTPVTARTVDCISNTAFIQTGFAELDFNNFIG